jgi:hypothetical protein
MSLLAQAIAGALDVMRDLSAEVQSPCGSNARVHTLVHAAQAALRRVEDAGATSQGCLNYDLIEHISRHRSDADSTNPHLYVQQLVGAVMHDAGVARAQRAALASISSALRGSAESGACAAVACGADDAAEASSRGVGGAYQQLFDVRTGAPLALPHVDEAVQTQLLSSSTLASLHAVPLTAHIRLCDTINTQLLGLPWTPMRQSDLDTFFSPFDAKAQLAAQSSADASIGAAPAVAVVAPLAPAKPLWAEVLEIEERRFNELQRIMPPDFEREVRALGNETFRAVALSRLLDRFASLRWPACTVGTPFVFSITRENAASIGVPNYYDVIDEPMDISRMRSRLSGGGGGGGGGGEVGYSAGSAGIDELFADAEKMIRNAKVFHGPKEARRAEPVFPEPGTLTPRYSAAQGSIYGMAFELEQLVKSSRLHANAALAAMQREELRKSYRDAGLAPFNDAKFWERVTDASSQHCREGGYAYLLIN